MRWGSGAAGPISSASSHTVQTGTSTLATGGTIPPPAPKRAVDIEPDPQVCACRVIDVDVYGVGTFVYCEWTRARMTGTHPFNVTHESRQHLRAAMKFYSLRWKFDGGDTEPARKRRDRAARLVRELT